MSTQLVDYNFLMGIKFQINLILGRAKMSPKPISKKDLMSVLPQIMYDNIFVLDPTVQYILNGNEVSPQMDLCLPAIFGFCYPPDCDHCGQLYSELQRAYGVQKGKDLWKIWVSQNPPKNVIIDDNNDIRVNNNKKVFNKSARSKSRKMITPYRNDSNQMENGYRQHYQNNQMEDGQNQTVEYRLSYRADQMKDGYAQNQPPHVEYRPHYHNKPSKFNNFKKNMGHVNNSNNRNMEENHGENWDGENWDGENRDGENWDGGNYSRDGGNYSRDGENYGRDGGNYGRDGENYSRNERNYNGDVRIHNDKNRNKDNKIHFIKKENTGRDTNGDSSKEKIENIDDNYSNNNIIKSILKNTKVPEKDDIKTNDNKKINNKKNEDDVVTKTNAVVYINKIDS